jgi:hypothetical protein
MLFYRKFFKQIYSLISGAVQKSRVNFALPSNSQASPTEKDEIPRFILGVTERGLTQKTFLNSPYYWLFFLKAIL